MDRDGEGSHRPETDEPAIVIPSSDGERYYPDTAWSDDEAHDAERRILQVIGDQVCAAAP